MEIRTMNYIKVPAKVIYKALTTMDGLAEIWTKDCKVADREGTYHTFNFGPADTVVFRIDALVPAKKVEWLCVQSDPDWEGTVVTFELQDLAGKSAVTLRHHGWKEVNAYFDYCSYNWSFFLYSLKRYCEEGRGIPYQDRKF